MVSTAAAAFLGPAGFESVFGLGFAGVLSSLARFSLVLEVALAAFYKSVGKKFEVHFTYKAFSP